MKIRKSELNLEKRIGVTREIHDILKKERKKQKKSMARIVNDLIIQIYGDETLQ